MGAGQDMGPGRITYLPVRTASARLFIGDAPTCQGDGKVCGVAVEYPRVITIRVDLIKSWAIEGLRLEKDDMVMTIGSAQPLRTRRGSPIANWSAGWRPAMASTSGTPICC